MVERSLIDSVSDTLAVLGHKVGEWPERSWRAGGVCLVEADLKKGVITGGADPRRPSYVIGW